LVTCPPHPLLGDEVEGLTGPTRGRAHPVGTLDLRHGCLPPCRPRSRRTGRRLFHPPTPLAGSITPGRSAVNSSNEGSPAVNWAEAKAERGRRNAHWCWVVAHTAAAGSPVSLTEPQSATESILNHVGPPLPFSFERSGIAGRSAPRWQTQSGLTA